MRRLALSLLVLALIVPGPAKGLMASTGDASEFIQKLGDQALEVLGDKSVSLRERETTFRGLLSDGFDLNLIGRFVLGRYWRTATEEQRANYQRVFGEYILQTYSAMLGGYSGETLTVLSEQPSGKKDVIVRTRIDRPDGAPVQAEWRVRNRDGAFKIVDVMVEGISMAVTQRGEFQSVIQRHGIDGLIQILEAKSDKEGAVPPEREASASQN